MPPAKLEPPAPPVAGVASPAAVVELGFADGARELVPAASPQAAELLAAAARLLRPRD